MVALVVCRKAWTDEDDKKLRQLAGKHGDANKWATIAVEAAFGHDSASCEKRWRQFVNPKLQVFCFGGKPAGGEVQGQMLEHGHYKATFGDGVTSK